MFKKLRLLVNLCLIVVVLIYAVAFAQKNNAEVPLDFLIGDVLSMPVGLWLGVGIVLGTFLGMAASVWAMTGMRFKNRRLRRQITELEQQA